MVLIVLGSVQRIRVEICQGLLTSLELPVALKSINPVPSWPPSLPGSFSFPTIPPFNLVLFWRREAELKNSSFWTPVRGVFDVWRWTPQLALRIHRVSMAAGTASYRVDKISFDINLVRFSTED